MSRRRRSAARRWHRPFPRAVSRGWAGDRDTLSKGCNSGSSRRLRDCSTPHRLSGGWKGCFFNADFKTRPRITQSSSPRAKRPCPCPPPEKRSVPQDDTATLCVIRGLVLKSVLKKRPVILSEQRTEANGFQSNGTGARACPDRWPPVPPSASKNARMGGNDGERNGLRPHPDRAITPSPQGSHARARGFPG